MFLMVGDLIHSGSAFPLGLACLGFCRVSVRRLAAVWAAVCSPSGMATGRDGALEIGVGGHRVGI